MTMTGNGAAISGRSLDLLRLKASYQSAELTVTDLVRDILARIAAAGDDKVWISRVPADQLLQRAETLDRMAAADPEVKKQLPLFGIPFAVKDNIDVAGLETTAACPAFAFRPEKNAFAVERLIEAGAIVIGKTNLDQFATGLVGTRSPYGVARNPFDADYIPGGSSSGSAVAVSSGLVSFSLGTDTAGSGRVPASFNNIVGLKPTKGLLSTSGVVPACASLDCISIFALTVADAKAVLAVAAGFDAEDKFSRPAPAQPTPDLAKFRFGVPRASELEFFGDAASSALYAEALKALEAIGGTAVEFDYTPFRDTAKLLYDGPWVAERMAGIDRFFREQPEAILPVTRGIIGNADKFNAVDTFKAIYRLAEFRREGEAAWEKFDFMVLPTAPSIYTVAQLEAEPVKLNSQLGYYTNFVNLLDYSALAVPTGFRPDGLPFGVTFVGPAFFDVPLTGIGSRVTQHFNLPLGAGHHPLPAVNAEPAAKADGIPVAVFGAHLTGMPMNHQLRDRGARFLEEIRTAPVYRMFFIAGEPPRPGIVRVADEGKAIDAELWSMDEAALGALVAEIAPPLSVGTLELADGRQVKGFLCEANATAGTRDISSYGGWRNFLGEKKS